MGVGSRDEGGRLLPVTAPGQPRDGHGRGEGRRDSGRDPGEVTSSWPSMLPLFSLDAGPKRNLAPTLVFLKSILSHPSASESQTRVSFHRETQKWGHITLPDDTP